MSVDPIKLKIDEIIEIQDKIHQGFLSWIKLLISLSVGLFGILVSFKSDIPMSNVTAILYVISISTLGLGIFFGLIVLSSELHILKRVKQNKVDYVSRELAGEKMKFTFEDISVAFRYTVAKFCCILFYLASLFSLIGYATYDLIINMI